MEVMKSIFSTAFLHKNFADLFVYKEESKLFFLLLLLVSLYVYPIIHADVYHRDDLERILLGNYSWLGFGRPLANIVTGLISGSSNFLADTAPLTQILSALLLGYSALIFSKYIKRHSGSYYYLIAVLPFLNPYFLHNLSYRYDSFSMSLSICFVAMAFVLNPKSKLNIFISIALLIGSLMLYQSTLNLLFAFLAIEVLLFAHAYSINSIGKTILMRAGQVVGASIFYYLLIRSYSSLDTGRGSTIAFNLEGLTTLIDNALGFIGKSLEMFTSIQSQILLILLCLIAFLSLVLAQASKPQRLGQISLCYVFALLLFVVSLFGPLVLLDTPRVTYRTIPSVHVYAAILVLMAALNYKKAAYIAWAPIIFSISFSFTYGTTYKNQRDYEKSIVNFIHYDLLERELDKEVIYTMGGMPRAPHAKMAMQIHPLLENMVEKSHIWMLEGLLLEAGLENTQYRFLSDHIRRKPELSNQICHESEMLVSNSVYEIYKGSDAVFVVLEKGLCEETLR